MDWEGLDGVENVEGSVRSNIKRNNKAIVAGEKMYIQQSHLTGMATV